MRPINFVTRWNVKQQMPVTEIYVNGLLVTKAMPKMNHETFKNEDETREAGYHEIVGDELRKDQYGLLATEVEVILDYLSKIENFEQFEGFVGTDAEEDVKIESW